MATLVTILPNPHAHGRVVYCSFYDPPPPPDKMIVGYWYDAVSGTAVIPSPVDVRDGVAVGVEVGSLAVPSPADVLAGVPTDDTVGTYAPLAPNSPDPADVRSDAPLYGPDLDLQGTYEPDLPAAAAVLNGTIFGVGDVGGPFVGTFEAYIPPTPLTGVMNFRVVTQALIDTLGASAAGKFTVVGYRGQVKSAEEIRGNGRTVQVFYSDGNFPKSKGRQFGAAQHLPEFTIELKASAAASGDLSAIDNPNSTTQQVAGAIANFQNASYQVGVAFDELLEMVYQILMDTRTFDLNLGKGVMSSRWIESMHKDGAQSAGSLVVQTGRVVYTCQTVEDVVGVAGTPMTTGIGTVLDISGDDIERTGVSVA